MGEFRPPFPQTHRRPPLCIAGKKQWEFATGGPIVSSPAVNKDESIYFTSVDGFCYAVNGDGTLRWRLRTGGITESSPVIGLDGTIYVGVNESLWALTPDGKKKWDANGDALIEAAPLAFADGSVCFASQLMLIAQNTEGYQKWVFGLWNNGYASPAVGPTGVIYAPCRVANRSPRAPGQNFAATRRTPAISRTARSDALLDYSLRV